MSFQPAASLTIDTAPAAMTAGLQAIAGGEQVFDFSGVTAIDSAAVAVLLAWQRAARAGTLALSFINVPPALQSLASLYGVANLLPGTVDVSRFIAPTGIDSSIGDRRAASPDGPPNRSDLPHH